jgi:hypothetical protein
MVNLNKKVKFYKDKLWIIKNIEVELQTNIFYNRKLLIIDKYSLADVDDDNNLLKYR